MSKARIRAALIVVLALIIGVAAGGMGFAAGWCLRPVDSTLPSSVTINQEGEAQQRFRVFWEAWEIIEREFNHEGLLDTQKMIYGAISGMVRSLGDPYTVFVEPAQAKLFDDDLEGSFEGIGATVDMVDGYLVIQEPLPGSPALRAGLRAGDIVLEADGKSLKDLDLAQAITTIRGPKGTKVRLLILRPGESEPMEVTIIRDKIDLPTVSYRMLDGEIAYVQLTEFNSQATTRLVEALRSVMENKPKGLIFDLRGNPGGYLHISVQVASQFIREGVIVTEKDRNGRITEHKAEGGGLALDIPLAVLVDGGTASAAEIVAGAIQDTGRGVLIGSPTVGKGSTQVAHRLSDGSSLRVSVTRWYTPKGRQLNGKGLTPDISVSSETDQADGDPVLEQAMEYLTASRTYVEASGS